MSDHEKNPGKIDLRVPPGLKKSVSWLAEQRKQKVSRYVRDVVEHDTSLWVDSPQLVSQTLHLLFVNRHGTFTYYRKENVELHSHVTKIGVRLGMKDAKARYFLGKPRVPLDTAWGMCAFRLTEASSKGPRPHVQVDPRGSISKNVLFGLSSDRGTSVTIETVAVLRDYAQQQGDDGEADEDEADFDVDVPTSTFEAIVVLDARIYDGDHRYSKNPPDLPVVLKNLNGVDLLAKGGSHGQKLVRWIHRDDTKSEFFRQSKKRVRFAVKTVRDAVESLILAPQTRKVAGEIMSELGDLIEFDDASTIFQRAQMTACKPGLRLAVSWPFAPRLEPRPR